MSRDELERLDRDTLVGRAERLGVARARVLTKPELIDELLLRSTSDYATRQRARGLFGRARDLIARVVERGLHLPDAADRIRSLGLVDTPRPTAPAALPTVTLAQIYAAQGHRSRAIETLRSVIEREPDHAVAVSLLSRLEDVSYPFPVPVLPPEEEAASPPEPFADPVPDPRPAPRDVDECTAVLVDRDALRISWCVRRATLDHARRTHPGARLAVCVLVVRPTWDGPRTTVQHHEVEEVEGEMVAHDVAAGSVVRAAMGCARGDGFVPFSHSGSLETPAAPVAAGAALAAAG
jgi:hypothetical protein